MSCQDSLAEWTSCIRTHLPLLSKPQATVLALWSLGMVLARSCALSAVSVWRAALLQRQDNTVRQPLREWCYEAQAKRGAQRQAPSWKTASCPCCAGCWGTGRAPNGPWPSMPPPWASASRSWRSVWSIAACHPGGLDHLARSPACGLAVPLAAHAAPAAAAIPKGHPVIVLADRGLYAPWLFRRIVRLGWHPFLRINRGGTFRPDPQATYRPVIGFVPSPGMRWRGTGTAFKSPQRRLRCTRLACWEEGYTEPWLILTDVPPEASDAGW